MLSPILNTLLNDSQNAFLPGRNINDCFIVAQETLHFLHSANKHGVMIKLDFEKTFNNVKWEFLLDSLKGLRFGNKWITWINMCICSAKFSILVNGSPKGYFGASNDLREIRYLYYFLNCYPHSK